MLLKKMVFAEYKVKLFKIFLPIMLSQLISQIQMVIDRIFLGRLEVLYMSAIGNATAPVWTTMSFVFSLSMGASILISQSIGARNEKQAREYAASLLVFHNVLPVVLFFFWVFCAPMVYRLMGVSENVMGPCVTYTRFYAPVFLLIGTGAALNVILQSSGNTKPLVVYGIIRSGMNVILDYVMIFGKFGFPAMGIAGAAIATTVSEFIGAIYIFVRVVKSRHLITKPTLDEVRHAKLSLYLKSVKLGIPTASEDFCWNFGNLMLIRILNTINEFAAAIYSIVFTIEVLAVVVIGSIGNGTVTLSQLILEEEFLHPTLSTLTVDKGSFSPSFNPETKNSSIIFSINDEDPNAFIKLYQNFIYTNIGKDQIMSYNSQTRRQLHFKRSASLPLKIERNSDRLVILNRDGSISWYNPSLASVIVDWYMTTEGQWYEF